MLGVEGGGGGASYLPACLLPITALHGRALPPVSRAQQAQAGVLSLLQILRETICSILSLPAITSIFILNKSMENSSWTGGLCCSLNSETTFFMIIIGGDLFVQKANIFLKSLLLGFLICQCQSFHLMITRNDNLFNIFINKTKRNRLKSSTKLRETGAVHCTPCQSLAGGNVAT